MNTLISLVGSIQLVRFDFVDCYAAFKLLSKISSSLLLRSQVFSFVATDDEQFLSEIVVLEPRNRDC